MLYRWIEEYNTYSETGKTTYGSAGKHPWTIILHRAE